ncbi:MAG: NADH-quinone oxidoreductase subunit J [Ilumatobacteraceae bacterium]|jgi:NADH-quinone oxidoreductase subunit J|nr:NADH-quinone oxidoreductase subunit J [Actinomycetota bacterium]MDA3020398.1 NADH-quinone oxidoreductase subunit J [Actinomycetota bacterium]MDP4977525.1 NADH-quinone oxidoreductase subunit J [Ilumatobacteraceae bacterium]MDP5114048.1 NADH-quinone oxidoreductase subunit J [Ilumatobacteraceae bacterium]
MVAADLLVAQNVAFGIISLMMIVGALRVVTVNNVVHAALWLVVVLSGAAAQYLLLSAEFVAITQILVYVGAVMVLFLFGTMLTRARIGSESDLNNKNWALGIPVALLMLGVMSYVIIDGFGDERLIENPGDMEPIPVQVISDDIFGPYLLPFWALSFVLLVAVIGAIVLARKD